MKRYGGEGLPHAPRIALITGDALGNYVAVTPLAQMLRERFPAGVFHYFGGRRTEELWSLENAFDAGFDLFGSPPREMARAALAEGTYDLVINLERSEWAASFAALLCADDTYAVGPLLDEEGRGFLPFSDDPRGKLWSDPEWTSAQLTELYPFLGSGFIGEIFCRLCFLEGPLPSYRVASCDPREPVPQVLISTAASLASKLWPVDKWSCVLEELLQRGVSVGVIGAAPASQARYWLGFEAEEALIEEYSLQDLRGRFSLPKVAGALARAKQVVTIDNGVLHMAAAVGTPTIGLFRPGIRRLWTPPVRAITALAPDELRPVSDIQVSQVVAALEV